MRKGALDFTLSMLVSLGILFMVCAAIAGIVFYHINIPIESAKGESDMFVEMMIAEMTKRDEVTGRIVPGVIDKERFLKIEKMDWGYPDHLSARMTIGQDEIFVNKGLFKRTWPIVEAKLIRLIKDEGTDKGSGLDYPIEWPNGKFRYKIPIKYEKQDILEDQTLEIIVVVQGE